MTESIETLKRDAERYRALRRLHWSDDKLVVIRAAVAPPGTQTYSGTRLDEVADQLRAADQERDA